MPAITKGKVLVTGANGYIAMWVVKSLLDKGFSVRGTVRSESKVAYLKDTFSSFGDKFEVVVVPDITKVNDVFVATQFVTYSTTSGRCLRRGSERCRRHRTHCLPLPLQREGSPGTYRSCSCGHWKYPPECFKTWERYRKARRRHLLRCRHHAPSDFATNFHRK